VRGGIVGSSTESTGISIGATLQLDFPRFQALCQIIGRGEYAVEYWSLVAVNNVWIVGSMLVRLQRMRCIEPSPIITGGGGKGF
jgi:hypothetical protein